MKKLSLLFIGLLWAVQGWGYGFVVGGIYYNCIFNNYHVEVTYKNSEYNTYAGSISIPQFVYYTGDKYYVKAIGLAAFKNCDGLTNIYMPNTIENIDAHAFEHCDILTSISIPSSVTEIGWNAFGFNTSLNNVTFDGDIPSLSNNGVFTGVPNNMVILVKPEYYTNYRDIEQLGRFVIISKNNYDFSVENDGNIIYYRITSDTEPYQVSVTYSSSIQNSYSGNVSIPSTVTYNNKTYSVTGITECAFINSDNLVTITMPNTITQIGNDAFRGCTLLSSIVIPDYVTHIGIGAFQGCTSLSSVTLGNTASNIGESAFSGCTNLSTINWTAVNVATYPAYAVSDSRHPFYGCNNITTVNFTGAVQSIPHDAFNGVSSINSINIGSSVTTIGDRAFNNCSGIGSVALGASVSTIGEKAFCGCSGMTSLSIDNLLTEVGISAFEGCSGLSQAIVLPPFVTKVHNRAFFGCSGITSLTLGINVNTLGDNAFNNCTSLASVEWKSLEVTSFANDASHAPFVGCTNLANLSFANNVRSIPDYAFIGTSIASTTLPNALQTIGKYAFQGVSTMSQELTIPNNVTSIGEYAFKGCSGLTSVTFGSGITNLGNYSFRECTGLSQDVIIPNSVATIGEGAFYGCNSITGVAIGSNVTTIGNLAFNGCSSLSAITWNATNVTSYPTEDNMLPFISCNNFNTINIGNGVTNIPAKAFLSCTTVTTANIGNSLTSIPDNAFYNCSSLTSINIPNSVTSIGTSAFKFCVGIETLNMPSVTSIGASAFDGCVSLSYLAVPEGVTTIGDYTFQNCSTLESASLPSTITSVGASAFKNAVSLSTMRCFATSVPSANTNAFENVSSSMNLQVPQSSVAAYQATAPWSNFNITGVVSHTITATASPVAGGTISGSGSYAFGSTATLTATANQDYSFVNWTENNVVVSTEPHFSFTVTGDRNLVANFTYGTSYNVTAVANPTEGGSVSGGGSYLENTVATVVANANSGYSFVNWTEGGGLVSTNQSYSFTVNCNRNLVANFMETGSNHWIPNPSLYADNMSIIGQIQIDGVNQNVSTLEVGAFCGNEVRGSQRPQYLGGNIDKYVVFLTVYGNANDVITFKLYNHQTQEEMNLISPAGVTFVANGTEGSVSNPHILNYISTVSITATANPVAGGNITGSGNYTIGNSVTLTANANNGYTFSNWTEGGNIVSTNASYSFTATANRNLVANFIMTNHWVPNTSLYADNMSIIGIIQLDGEEQRTTNLEIGAFCGDEVRGSQRPQYISGSIDRYIFFLTVYGQASNQITFKLYDHSTNEELDLTSPAAVSFVANGTTGSVGNPHVMNFTSTVAIAAACNPSNAGTITGTGDYPIGANVTITASANTGYAFKNWTRGGNVVSTNPSYSFTVSEAMTFVANFDFVQSRQLSSGWNWYSTYIDVSGASGLTMMENGLGTDAMQIKSQTAFVTYDYGMWYGALTAVNVEQMYMIQMNVAHTLNMSGSVANASAHPISISNGWKWIGYPVNQTMSIDAALANFTPHNGDYIKSQTGFSQYYEGIGWLGALSTLSPGNGYMYQNTSGSAKTLVYATPSKSNALGKNITPKGNHWEPDMYQYANNMSVVAAVSINGEIQNSESLEVAAFCDSECRGSAKPMFIEQLEKYVVFLTIYGNENDEITFKLFNAEDNEEFPGIADEMMTFSANGTVGSVSTPYIINFGFSGVGEMTENTIEIYPNPASKNTEIKFGENYERVEVFNSIGMKVAEYHNVGSIDGFEITGVYVIRVTNSETTITKKLIIK